MWVMKEEILDIRFSIWVLTWAHLRLLCFVVIWVRIMVGDMALVWLVLVCFLGWLYSCGDSDFFMRKAIGWALRQYARVDAEAVVSFVDDMGDSLSGLSRREALKRVSSRQGEKDT